MPTVTIYGKPGCHLCEDALDALLDVRATHPFEIVEVNIARDPALIERYGEQIPVVLLDGELMFEYEVDPALLRQRLEEVKS
jgi:glutaredoxin